MKFGLSDAPKKAIVHPLKIVEKHLKKKIIDKFFVMLKATMIDLGSNDFQKSAFLSHPK